MFLIHAFVIDDDQDAIKKMETYSKENPGMITIVGSAKSIATSHHALSQLQPDLILLRATKENLSHFESFRSVDVLQAKWVFIGPKEAAYEAFKYHATDFLVFPFDADEFTATLLKVKYAIERELAPHKIRVKTWFYLSMAIKFISTTIRRLFARFAKQVFRCHW